METKLLLLPPIAFLVIFFSMIGLERLVSLLAFKNEKKSEGTGASYACGEDFHQATVQPDYSQFFPFAFFFTVLHVFALVMGTVPFETLETLMIAFIYIIGAVIGLTALLRD